MSNDYLLNLQPGTIVNGRYEVVKCLGTGSVGMVYACRHRELAGHLVAMKVLFSEVAQDEVIAARFKNEIVASYGVNHPNVVRAYEYFKDGDLIAFTMEFVGGGDIADKISTQEVMSIPDVIKAMMQITSGVQAIHDAGIIHRDLKPENILLTNQGDVKITDFGIARTDRGPKLTEHGGVVGTIDYVSPEYLEKGDVDARADIYAIGVIAYEIITKEAPFKGNTMIETMTMRLRTDPVPPHRLRADCPEELSNIVLKSMSRDINLRYQTSAEMYEDLFSLAKKINLKLTPNSQKDLKIITTEKNSVTKPLPVYARNEEVVYTSSGPETSYTSTASPSSISSIMQSEAEELFRSNTADIEPDTLNLIRGIREDGVKEHEVKYTPQENFSGSKMSHTASQISVTENKISSERLKLLSLDRNDIGGSLFWSLMSLAIIFASGFGAGWIVKLALPRLLSILNLSH